MAKFRAKYNSTGFRGLSWRAGTEVEITEEEYLNDPCAKHFEPVDRTAKTWPVVRPEHTFKEQLNKVVVDRSKYDLPPRRKTITDVRDIPPRRIKKK
jgi:hypothetical protein